MQLTVSVILKCFTIAYRWEQTQQKCEMRKEIFSIPISTRSWSIMKAVDMNIIPLGKWLNFRWLNVT